MVACLFFLVIARCVWWGVCVCGYFSNPIQSNPIHHFQTGKLEAKFIPDSLSLSSTSSASSASGAPLSGQNIAISGGKVAAAAATSLLSSYSSSPAPPLPPPASSSSSSSAMPAFMREQSAPPAFLRERSRLPAGPVELIGDFEVSFFFFAVSVNRCFLHHPSPSNPWLFLCNSI